MKALFLGTLAASQATPIIEFITADIRTEIVDDNEPAQGAAALTDADVVLTGAWRSGFPAAPQVAPALSRHDTGWAMRVLFQPRRRLIASHADQK